MEALSQANYIHSSEVPPVDVLEDSIIRLDPQLLDILLFDRTTRNNILWATDGYAYLGDGYEPDSPIMPEQITGEHSRLIQPRTEKSQSEQDNRTKTKAEVFTPSWICNAQNSLLDEQWFGRSDVFNIPDGQNWTPTPDRILFPKQRSRSWKKYVDARQMEISCGEAPYLVSRYDTVTGELIPLECRIGILDRKLRIVNENAESESDWLFWATRAFQSVYGYEFQGDNLLLARENLLLTYIDYYLTRLHRFPEKRQLLAIARIISWNLWQMDGLKGVVPFSCKPVVTETYTLFGTERTEEPCPGCKNGDIHRHTGVYCKIHNWRDKYRATQRYIDMIGGEDS